MTIWTGTGPPYAPAASRPLAARAWRGFLTLTLCLTALPAGVLAGSQDYFSPRERQHVLESTSPRDADYLADVGSRLILPRLDTPIPFEGGRAIVYLQFEDPLKPDERAAAIQTGVRFYGVVDAHTYLARIQQSDYVAVKRLPRLRGIEPVVYADRLTQRLYRGEISAHAALKDDLFLAIVRFYPDVGHAHALSTLDESGIVARDRKRMLFANRLLVEANWKQVMELSDRMTVQSICQIPPPSGVTNHDAQILSNVDIAQGASWGLTGTGVNMGIWDGGPVRDDHPDLTGRISVQEAGTNNDHATHVAGTMMGDGSNNIVAEGMAPGAPMLYSYDFGNTGNEPTEMAGAVADFGIRVANHSWGFILGWVGLSGTDAGFTELFGAYDTQSPVWDLLVRNTDLIVVKSSGNDRNDCDPGDPTDCDGVLGADGEYYDNIPERGTAKNVITIGATEDDGTITAFSSAGPANDGRIKPDVVANGSFLTSTWAGGTTLADCGVGTDYCSISGTSMSTPVVSGISALLLEHYRNVYSGAWPDACTIKAILVNTAMDRGRPGPDYLFGHGIADARGAVETIADGPVRIVNESIGQTGVDEYWLLVPDFTDVLDVTLAWTDIPGNAGMNADDTNPDLVNDLDVELIAPSNAVHYPWMGPGLANPASDATRSGPNTLDNVERATVNLPETGVWRIRVRGTAVPEGEQQYCLVTSEALALEEQPNIVLNAPLNFYELCFGEWQDIDCTIYNTGGAPLFVHDVSITAGFGDFRLLQPPTPPFLVLPGSHVDVTVRFSPGEPGVHSGLLTIFSNDPDEPFLDVPMTGSGGVQDLKTSLEAHGNFRHVNLGEFRTLEYQIINQGTCDLTVTSLHRVSGSIEFDLGEQPGAALFPLTIFPGEHVQVFFRYEPGDYSFDAAAWQLETDDPDTPTRMFELQGRCMPPDIALTGSTEFGVVCAGDQAEKVLDVCNVGKSDLVVFGVDFVEPCGDFILVNSPFPPAVPEPNVHVSHDFCLPVTIRYTPTGVGEHSCVLQILSSDPDESILELLVTGETPAAQIDVPDDLGFPPTVVQQVEETCQSAFPFTVTNTGPCDVQIVDIAVVPPAGGDPNYTDFVLEGLPELPLYLQPGHAVGNGLATVVFRPTAVRRFIEARVEVTWVSHDPLIGDTETVYVALCGEGVNTGARLLATKNGVPLPHVDKITLWAIDDYGEPTQSSWTVEVTLDVYLQQVLAGLPCEGFFFHHEWGGETNPIVLPPGWYRAETAVGTESPPDRTVEFYIPDVCTFIPDLVIDYP